MFMSYQQMSGFLLIKETKQQLENIFVLQIVQVFNKDIFQNDDLFIFTL